MGFFIKEKFTSKEGNKFWIFSPTILKKGRGVVFIKGKTEKFIKSRRK